jgi:hypothetical protein
MRRPLFFLIIAVVGLVFSGFMLLLPTAFAQNAGLSTNPETAFLFRALGAMILSVTLANFMVRNHPDSATLAAVLWMNVATHVLAGAVDLVGEVQGLVTFAHSAPGLVVHVAIAVGAYIYASRMDLA